METGDKVTISVETTVHTPVEKVWENWIEPQHITKWCNASDDWHEAGIRGSFMSYCWLGVRAILNRILIIGISYSYPIDHLDYELLLEP